MSTAALGDELLAAALTSLPEAVLLTDVAGSTVYVNAAFTTLTGYTAAEMRPMSYQVLHGPETAEEDVAAILVARAAGEPFRGRLLHYRKDGRPFWCGLSLAPLRAADGTVTFFIGLMRDISDRVAGQTHLVELLQDTEQAHSTADALLRVARSLPQAKSTRQVVQLVAEAIPQLCEADRSAVALWDEADGQLSITAISGWEGPLAEEARSYTLRPRDSPELAAMLQAPLPVLVDRRSGSAWATAALERFAVTAFVAVPVLADGALQGLLLAYWSDTPPPSTVKWPLRERLSGLAGISAVALDNVRLFEQVRHLADHDPLTGLANRAVLIEELSRALAARSDDEAVAVIFCDIDQLKQINDSMGHRAGDQVLQEVARRIASLLTGPQLVARVGGDEFVLVLPGVQTEAEVDELVGRIHALVMRPLRLEGRTVSLRLSTGVVVAGLTGAGDTWDAESAVQVADYAMYEQRVLGPLARGSGRRSLTLDLAGALEREEITPVYQPILDLTSGRVVGVEALARWAHPQLGALMPDQFIPLAELIGVVHEIGRTVLRSGCRLLAMLEDDFPDLELSINVSAAELARGLAEDVLAALNECGLSPARLTLEITESLLVREHHDAAAQLRHLRDLGVGIALDDFGTGYTGIGQLRDLPVSEMKIDRSFLQPRRAGEPDLLAALIHLAHAVGLRAVAEGIETPAQHQRIRQLGCDRAQGFLYGHPMTAVDLVSALRKPQRPFS